jgi:hypothetical protein
MSGRMWEDYEIEYLNENGSEKPCSEIAEVLQRTPRAVQHMYNALGIKKRQAKIGDIINGWKIVELYIRNNDSQNITYAKVESTISDKIGEYKLTQLTQGKVGWPDRRRPDVTNKITNHHLCNTRLYSIWNGMKTRCYNKNQPGYKNYGGRGITICEEWFTFMNFYNWAMSNGYADNLTINRKNNDGNYCSENCNWITVKEQSYNKSDSVVITAWGETKNACDWVIDTRCKVSYDTLLYRIRVGWNPEFAISLATNGTKDGFNRYKDFYKFAKEKHPDKIEEFLQSGL